MLQLSEPIAISAAKETSFKDIQLQTHMVQELDPHMVQTLNFEMIQELHHLVIQALDDPRASLFQPCQTGCR